MHKNTQKGSSALNDFSVTEEETIYLLLAQQSTSYIGKKQKISTRIKLNDTKTSFNVSF